VRADVRALYDGIGAQMQALHDALADEALERETRLASQVAALRADDAAGSADARARVEQALARLDEGVRALASAVSEGAARPVVLAPPEPAPELAAAPSPGAAAAGDAPPEAPGPEAAAGAAPKKRFLSFRLPSQAFAFDQRQRFAIVPSLSRVGFDAKSTLHDFSGVTSAVQGEITADLSRPGEGCGGSVIARAASLDTGVEGRDESMREILEPERYPDLRFDWRSFAAERVDVGAQTLTGTAMGTLTIHGTAREVAMPVAVAVDASKRVTIDGQMKFKLSDFGVKPPSKLGLVSVEDEAALWIALRARSLGPAPVEAH
jgi:polyisoprenoid-binding protein YceI